MSVTQPDEPAEGWTDDAFTAICDRHRGRLVRYLTAIFGPRDAEDIAQEALARLYVRPGLVDDAGDAWPWLAVVGRNVGRDLARHNAHATAVDAHDLAELPGETRVWDQVSARDDADRLARALARLSGPHRRLIRMRDVHGLGIAEIAELTGTNENAVRQQLFRARRKLQHAYLSLGGDRQFGGLGLLSQLSLRVREFFRRHAPAVDAITCSAASVLLAGALSGLAAALGGVLPFGGAHHGRPRHAAATTAAADRDPRHGSAVVPWTPVGRLAVPRPHMTSSPIIDEHQDLPAGDLSVDAHVQNLPLSGTGDRGEGGGIWVHNPVTGGDTGVWWENRESAHPTASRTCVTTYFCY